MGNNTYIVYIDFKDAKPLKWGGYDNYEMAECVANRIEDTACETGASEYKNCRIVHQPIKDAKQSN